MASLPLCYLLSCPYTLSTLQPAVAGAAGVLAALPELSVAVWQWMTLFPWQWDSETCWWGCHTWAVALGPEVLLRLLSMYISGCKVKAFPQLSEGEVSKGEKKQAHCVVPAEFILFVGFGTKNQLGSISGRELVCNSLTLWR